MKLDKKWSGMLLFAGVFIFMLVWYTSVHPFVVFSFDDWRYISKTRVAVPLLSEWNPTRILPELLMPACGYIAAYLIYPFTNDYIGSLTIMFALAGALATASYVYAFYSCISKRFELGEGSAVLIAVMFLGLHFLALRSGSSENQYLLGGDSPTILFYYFIPALLNGCLVMHFEKYGGVSACWKSSNAAAKACIVTACYFAVCSNMYCSIILAVYAGWQLLMAIICQWKARQRFKSAFFRENAGPLLLLGGWLVSIIIEYFGGRATKLKGMTRSRPLYNSAGRFYVMSCRLNHAMLILAGIVLVLCIVLIWRRRSGKDQSDTAAQGIIWMCACCFSLTAIYSVLLASMVAPSDMMTAKVWVVILFFFLFGLCVGLSYLVRRLPRMRILLPIISIALLSMIVVKGQGQMFMDGTAHGIDASICRAVDNEMIRQTLEAEREGLQSVSIEIPQCLEKGDNWPFNPDTDIHYANALYRHGLLPRYIDVDFVPSQEIYEYYFKDRSISGDSSQY